MSFDAFAIDISRYRTVSALTVTGTISVGTSLLQRQLSDVPDFVTHGANKLAKEVKYARDRLTDRLDGKADLGLERSFDLLVDRVWAMLKARMEFWQCYNHQGVALLRPDQQIEAEIENNRKLAAVAQELLARLFGDGTDFLRMPYAQQAAHMAARLNYIETRGLQAEFVELVGAQPATLVKICQDRYEAMIADRSARNDAVTVDLRPLRSRVRAAAENYANLLLSTLDDGDEEWAKAVFAALQPMLSTERLRTRTGAEQAQSEGETGAEAEAPLEDEFVELVDDEAPLVEIPSETDSE